MNLVDTTAIESFIFSGYCKEGDTISEALLQKRHEELAGQPISRGDIRNTIKYLANWYVTDPKPGSGTKLCVAKDVEFDRGVYLNICANSLVFLIGTLRDSELPQQAPIISKLKMHIEMLGHYHQQKDYSNFFHADTAFYGAFMDGTSSAHITPLIKTMYLRNFLSGPSHILFMKDAQNSAQRIAVTMELVAPVIIKNNQRIFAHIALTEDNNTLCERTKNLLRACQSDLDAVWNNAAEKYGRDLELKSFVKNGTNHTTRRGGRKRLVLAPN